MKTPVSLLLSVLIITLLSQCGKNDWQPTTGMEATITGNIGSTKFSNEKVRMSLSTSNYDYLYGYITNAAGTDYYLNISINDKFSQGVHIKNEDGGVETTASINYNLPGWRDNNTDEMKYRSQTITKLSDHYHILTLEVYENHNGTIRGNIQSNISNQANKGDIIEVNLDFKVGKVNPDVNTWGIYND